MTKGQTAPRTVTRGLRQRAWWVICRRKTVTVPELLNTLAEGTERAAENNLNKYLRALARAGILRQEEKRAPGAALTSNGYCRYTLIIYNGRRAPVWRNSRRAVYDPNTGVEYPIDGEDEQ